jgi:hypothetical protein
MYRYTGGSIIHSCSIASMSAMSCGSGSFWQILKIGRTPLRRNPETLMKDYETGSECFLFFFTEQRKDWDLSRLAVKVKPHVFGDLIWTSCGCSKRRIKYGAFLKRPVRLRTTSSTLQWGCDNNWNWASSFDPKRRGLRLLLTPLTTSPNYSSDRMFAKSPGAQDQSFVCE